MPSSKSTQFCNTYKYVSISLHVPTMISLLPICTFFKWRGIATNEFWSHSHQICARHRGNESALQSVLAYFIPKTHMRRIQRTNRTGTCIRVKNSNRINNIRSIFGRWNNKQFPTQWKRKTAKNEMNTILKENPFQKMVCSY